MVIVFTVLITAPAWGLLARNRESAIVGAACALGVLAAIWLRA